MTTGADGQAMAEELRETAAAFVNSHVDLWVGVEDDGTLVLAASEVADLFRAAADWLAEEDSRYEVLDVRWERRAEQPANVLRLRLGRAGDAVAVPGAAEAVG